MREFAVETDPAALSKEFRVSGLVRGGRRDGQAWEEIFRCLPEPPGEAEWLIMSVATPLAGGIGVKAQAILRFIQAVLEPDDEDRWQALLADKRRIVPSKTLGDIAGYLIEEYGALPTPRSSGSAPGGPPLSGTQTES